MAEGNKTCLPASNALVRRRLEDQVVTVVSKYKYLDKHELEHCLKMCLYRVKENKI